jgi:integrase
LVIFRRIFSTNNKAIISVCLLVLRAILRSILRAIMISVHFFLKTPKKKWSPIYVRVHVDGKEIGAISIHESILTNWNEAKQKHIKPIWNHAEQRASNYKLLNEKIADLKNKLETRIREMGLKGETPTTFDIAYVINPDKAKKKDGVIDPKLVKEWYAAWGKWYLNKKNRRARKKNIQKEESGSDYVRSFKQICDKVHEFLPNAKLKDFLPEPGERFEEGLVYEFEDWVSENYDLQDNTLLRYRKFFRAMFRFANMPFGWLEVGSMNKNPKFALTWPEVLQLVKTPYCNSNEEKAAHAAVIITQIALRWGDAYRLQPSHVIKIKTKRHGEVLVVDKNQNKTGNPIYIPLPPVAEALFKQYQKLPVHFTKNYNGARCDFNRYLKDAARYAGLDRVIRLTKIYDGQVEESWQPLHEIISAHILRHTGATLIDAVFEGENDKLVKRLLGHAENDVTSGYTHADPIITVDKLLDAWVKIENS